MIKKSLLLLSVLLIAGCSKLTMENYQQLKAGMTYDEVTSIIGSAKECKESLGTNRCVWGDEDGVHVKINFISDAAVLFSHEGLK